MSFFFFGSMAQQPLVGEDLLTVQASQLHSVTHIAIGRNPLDEWSAWCRNLYLTTNSTDKRQTSMPPAGFQPAIPASERPQTHALDRAATGIGSVSYSTMATQFQDTVTTTGTAITFHTFFYHIKKNVKLFRRK